MALSVVIQNSDRRALAAFTSSDDADTYVTASGASTHSKVDLTDSQQGDEDHNSILGKTVSASGVVAAYTMTGVALRNYRRNQCYDLIRQGYEDMPLLSTAESDTRDLMVKYLRHCYAAAATDSNMDNPMRFGEVESACKGGDIEGGMPGFWEHLVITTAAQTAWSTALDDSVRVVSSPNSSGGVSAKSAILPATWATSADYNPVRARRRKE